MCAAELSTVDVVRVYIIQNVRSAVYYCIYIYIFIFIDSIFFSHFFLLLAYRDPSSVLHKVFSSDTLGFFRRAGGIAFTAIRQVTRNV